MESRSSDGPIRTGGHAAKDELSLEATSHRYGQGFQGSRGQGREGGSQEIQCREKIGVTKQKVGSCCLMLPTSPHSESKGLVIKEESLLKRYTILE